MRVSGTERRLVTDFLFPAVVHSPLAALTLTSVISSQLCPDPIFVDHFNLQEDMDNYMYYTMMGGPVRLKPGVRPHKFDCQGKVTPHNENWEKLKRKMNTSKILSSVENINEADQNPPNQPDPEEARNECEDLNDPESLKPSTKNVGIQLQVHHSQKLSQPPLHPRVAVQDLSPARRKQCRDAAPYGQHLCPYIPPARQKSLIKVKKKAGS
ncbi:hypothetical protein Pmani_000190 [Petrolisthes manimaculis]|uniref:Uncharacterized protein n=1 Tax=Petrolisthes manimaculis TaxID=1843537 RepID=A0AAE1UMK4_9EUCA|nr:hypothetical protein Pmani_000190 [Petrolisthes manimaculis]